VNLCKLRLVALHLLEQSDGDIIHEKLHQRLISAHMAPSKSGLCKLFFDELTLWRPHNRRRKVISTTPRFNWRSRLYIRSSSYKVMQQRCAIHRQLKTVWERLVYDISATT